MDRLVELNRKYWGDIHDMCENTNVKPWECVKREGVANFNHHPKFSEHPDYYEFAVAIVRGWPVFVGDTLYDSLDEGINPIVVKGINKNGSLQIGDMPSSVWHSWKENATWHLPKPKRTFTLNGVELPCPTRESEWSMRIDRSVFYFESAKDLEDVSFQVNHLLTEARYK